MSSLGSRWDVDGYVTVEVVLMVADGGGAVEEVGSEDVGGLESSSPSMHIPAKLVEEADG